MNIEISGTIYRIKDTETFGSGFQKREVIIRDDNEKYPQEYPVEFTKDRIALVDEFTEGDKINVVCSLNGREWAGHDKWFMSLSAWKVEMLSKSGKAQPEPHPAVNEMSRDDDDGSDLPF